MYPASWKTQIWSFGLLCKMFGVTVVKILYNQNAHVGCWREMEERDLGQVGISQINIHFPKEILCRSDLAYGIEIQLSWKSECDILEEHQRFPKGHWQANIKQSLTQPDENTLKLRNSQETILVTVSLLSPASLLSLRSLNWDYWAAWLFSFMTYSVWIGPCFPARSLNSRSKPKPSNNAFPTNLFWNETWFYWCVFFLQANKPNFV